MNLYESIKKNLKESESDGTFTMTFIPHDKKSYGSDYWEGSLSLPEVKKRIKYSPKGDVKFKLEKNEYGSIPEYTFIFDRKYLDQVKRSYESLKYGADVTLNESCEKKKIKIKESDLATYLGVTQSLLEKVNHANDDINAKIREALRSKGKAKKYADEFNKMGITIDDSPREGVELIGPNGKRLSADRLNIFGPAKPGHNDTHGGPWATNIKSKVKDLASYDKKIAEQKERIENLKNTEHDDIIRKYPNKNTEEALKAHEENIASEEKSLDWNKKWRKDAQKDIEKEHNRRERGHNSNLAQSRIVDRKSPSADKIDYKNYLDSKDNDINKDYTVGGNLKQTPGQQVRDELKNKKYRVHDTYYYASDARDDIEDRKIDAKAIEARRKEIEEEYKKKLDDEVNNMLKKKSNADASYKGHKEDYNKRVSELNDFRKQHNLPTKDEDSFDNYLEKRANTNGRYL